MPDVFTHRAVLDELYRLDPDQRDCLVLRFLRGLSPAETAVAMDLDEGVIRTLQYRAVRALAERLPQDFEQ